MFSILSFGKQLLGLSTRSPKWKYVRSNHLKNYPSCSVCGSLAKPEVHHIVPFHINPSLELDPDNLITLCDKYCHFIFGHLMNWQSFNPDIKTDCQLFYTKISNRP